MDLDNDHNDDDDATDAEYVPEKEEIRSHRRIEDRRRRHNRHYVSGVWKHFKDLSGGFARCRYCGKTLSYRTTVTNLKKHLCNKHADVIPNDSVLATKNYLFTSPTNKYGAHKTKRKICWKYSEANDTSPGSNYDTKNTTVNLSSEIWSHFKQEDDEAKCRLCKESVPSNLDDMKNHLEDHHTNLLDEIISKAQQDQDADLGDDNISGENEVYTEVLYLEDESGNKINISPNKRKITLQPESIVKKKVKKERRISVSSDEPDVTTKEHIKKPVEDELEAFLSYIRILLKKIPKEASPKLHLDVINLIMNVQLNSQQSNVVLETDAVNNAN